MHSVTFTTCLATLLVGLTYAGSNQENNLENINVKSHRKPKISSEFGYNILNSDRLSNQFRQEHRDVNGVVRGSYGFKNPNGIFRLVQYIADNRGFRAHISSNEHGIGKQNPAGVSINRFDNQPSEVEEKIKPPISHLRKSSALQDMIENLKELRGDNNFDVLASSTRQNENSDKNQHYSLFRDEDNEYVYDTGRQEFYSSLRQNPVDKLLRTRFSIPNKIVSHPPSTDEYSSLRHDQVWNYNPFIRKITEHGDNQGYRDSYYPPLNVPIVLADRKRLEHTSETTKSNDKETFFNYPDYTAGLYPRPQQRVHDFLPDCNSVGSAVLCRPPLYLEEALEEYQKSKINPVSYNTHQTQIPKFVPHTLIENSHHAERANEFVDSTYDFYPPHLVPSSYPLRSEIYKKFLSDMTGLSQSKRDDANCRKGEFKDRKSSNDHLFTLESHKVPDRDITNDLSSYNLNAHAFSLSQKSDQETSQYSKRQNELYSRLVRIIQNDESLNKLKNLLLHSDTSFLKAESKPESPKLSLLGVLILPSSVIKELDYGQEENAQSSYIPEEADDKHFSKNSFESDIPDIIKYSNDINKTISTVDYDEDAENKNKISLKGDEHPGNDTKKFPLPPSFQVIFRKSNIAQNADYNLSSTVLPAETVTSPKLYVYDEQSLSDKTDKTNLNFSADNWRKILEDEISKEIRESSLRQDVPTIGASFDELENSEQTKKSDEDQYSFNKHVGPLYDSTGKMIQPENVPIHIHRFNPPSGLTSLPWKYAIPRPAPPRSIVVPPKPPTLA